MSSNNIVLSGTVELNFSSSGTDYLNPQSVDSTTGEFTPINLYGGEVYTGADFVITESQILSQYSSVDGSALSIQSIEFRDAENNLISLDYDATTGTYTRPFDGTDANYTNGVSVSYVIADENGGTSNIQYAYFFDTDNNNNSIVFNEEVLGSSEVTYETYDSVAGEYVDTAFNPSDVIDVSLNAGYDIKGYLPQVSADGTLTVTKSQLTDLFTDTDGDAISLLFGNGGFLVVGFNENEDYLDTPPPQVNANFAPGEDSITLDLSEFAQYDSVKLYVNVAGGADGAFVGLDVAFESSAPVINDTIVLSENLGDATAVVETFDVNDGSVVSTEPLEAGEVIPQPADAEIIIDNFLADATSGDTNYTITKAELEGLFTDLDGDAIVADQFLFATAVDQATDTFVDAPVTYDAATETYSVDTTAFTDAGFDSFRFVANVQGGTDDSVQAVLEVDIASGSVVEKGVEGEDFLYANALPENRDNNAIKKRGEDSITGHYWVNNRDSSLDETFVDGGEYAVIMGRRDELTADITGQEIVDGLVSGDFVATKSFTSYGGYAVNAAFEDGAIDSLVQSTGGEVNQLMVGRIDVESGELVGSLKRISGTEVWDNFNPSNSLSGRNDNAYGDILAQQNEQTGGF